MTHYEKIAFVWEEPKPFIQVPARLSFRSLNAGELDIFSAIVSRAMAKSLDRSDQKAVSEQESMQVAAQFIAKAKDDFDYQPDWWQVGLDDKGKTVGFIQPVIFRGSRKANLEEGTLYYIGVVPEHRGKHYIYDLLCQATRILQEVGVWRIYCDTDVVNTPMINAFQEVGYQQHGSPKKISL